MSDAAEIILNVDDSEAIRYAKTRILHRAGFRVLEAATGTQALRLAEEQRPTLVVLDVNLPDISGIEVCQRIKQAFPTMLVLQSSASFVDADDRVRGLEGGADAYLTEPVDPAELVAAVRALLRLRRAERAAQESEARYRAIVDSASDYAILTISPEGLVTTWNSGAERILGYASDAILGQPFATIFTPEDRAAGQPEREMREARESGRASDERWMQRRGGERFWADGVTRPLRDAEGRLLGYLKILRDQTERRRAEAALAESEARFRAITDAMPQIVWSATAHGVCDYRNSRWYEFIGGTDAGRAGDELDRHMHPDDRGGAWRRWRHAVASGEDFGCEFRLSGGADRGWRWFMARAVPIRDAAGRTTRWFGTCTDVQDMVEAREVQARGRDELERLVAERTRELKHALGRVQSEIAERERTEAALRQSQKMEAIGQLTGGVAHDFNNLLAGIGGSLELIRGRIASGRPADVGRYIDLALGEVARASSLTHRLLAFARRQALDARPISVNQLIDSIQDLIGRTIGPQITLHTTLATEAWPTLCDVNQMENALLNLCINARDAMPDGGRLMLATANVTLDARFAAAERDVQPGDYVLLSVTDTGSGMPPDVMARAFEPFYTTKPLGQGTGLGLSMIYGFVKQSGGHVSIESGIGRGTTVRLYLPRHHGDLSAVVTPSGELPVPQAAASRTVLVVEDEMVVRALVVEVLNDLGHVAIEAADAPAALHILRSPARIDLLVSDLGLPGMSGRRLADAAREVRPDLTILFMTGYAHDTLGTEPLPERTSMITKPFGLDTLASKIRDMIDAVSQAAAKDQTGRSTTG